MEWDVGIKAPVNDWGVRKPALWWKKGSKGSGASMNGRECGNCDTSKWDVQTLHGEPGVEWLGIWNDLIATIWVVRPSIFYAAIFLYIFWAW